MAQLPQQLFNGPASLEFLTRGVSSRRGGDRPAPEAARNAMRRIYHTMHFEVHDEKALHEFVRKHAEPEEFAGMEQMDAGQAEGEPVDHVYSDIEWIVENGHAFEADGLEHTGGETGDSDEEEDDEEDDED